MKESARASYVIDCSAVVKWFLIEEENAGNAVRFLEKATEREFLLFAPSILIIEFANVLSKCNKSKLMKIDKCKKHFNVFINYICNEKIINLISLQNNIDEILSLALVERISYFDAEYLYLSKKLKIDLITYDRQLKRIVGR